MFKRPSDEMYRVKTFLKKKNELKSYFSSMKFSTHTYKFCGSILTNRIEFSSQKKVEQVLFLLRS